jgi:hypothetical protein
MKKGILFLSVLFVFFLSVAAFDSRCEALGEPCSTDDQCGTLNVCLNNVCSPAPQYLLLFTHTEDHINHTPSEKRYWQFFPVIDSLAKRYPDAHVSWTVEFMGADTETIAQRNDDTPIQPGTHLLDFIKNNYAVNTTVFQFGYHGAHEPADTNNAIYNLPKYA